MAHNAARDTYRKLGKKIDSLPERVPWNETLYEILKELYTPAEAEVLVRMPYVLSDFERIARITRFDRTQTCALILDSLCEKGPGLRCLGQGSISLHACPAGGGHH